LKGVPYDEANEIRDLLNDNSITFYETPHGNHGEDMAAIWLQDNSQLKRAKNLISKYQQERTLKAREKYMKDPKNSFIEQITKNKPILPFYLFILLIVIYMLIYGVM